MRPELAIAAALVAALTLGALTVGPNMGYGMVDGSKWLLYQHVTVLTPPLPEYISGHWTVSQSGIQIFQSFTGTDPFGAYVRIERDSSKFEADTPSSDVVSPGRRSAMSATTRDTRAASAGSTSPAATPPAGRSAVRSPGR